MNAANSLAERMGRSTAAMRHVRALLIAPDEGSLAQAANSLDDVTRELERLVAEMSQNPRRNGAADLEAVERLRAEQERVARLVEDGSAFLSGCLRLIASHLVGYTMEGRPAPLPAVGQVSVEA